jgi:hypothetical protein
MRYPSAVAANSVTQVPAHSTSGDISMTSLSSTQSFFRLSLAGGLALGLATLAGCGIGKLDNSTSPVIAPAFTGKAMGGQMPIIGATVKVYATSSSGYGMATPLQEATQQGSSSGQDTDAGGNFSFQGGYTCPAGQFVYIVTSGGNTGANTPNANAVLVAALGRCEDLYVNTTGGNYNGPTVYINELTTVAAAYALGNFSAVTGTGAATSVLIGAPATNNAGQIGGVSTGCIANGTTCNTTAAAGLAHAFLNATNLVNPFANTSLSGANAKLPGDSAAVVPQELIDSLANILVSCVNSTGGNAGDGTGSNCTQLFAATTIGSSIPSNTFSAMVNLAANPTLGGSATAVANLYALATAQTNVYSPALTTAPLNDFSIGINYPSGLGASTAVAHLSTCKADPCQGLIYPISGALDINDVYYLGNQSASGGAAPVNLFAFSSNGNLLSNTGNGATLKFTFGLSVDALGNGYFGNASGSGTSALGVFSTGGGLLSQFAIKGIATGNLLKVYNTAVDRANNVWVFGPVNNSGTSTLYMSPSGGANFTAQANPGATIPGTPSFVGLAIDPNQNVWTTASTALSVLQNTGTLAAPTYVSTSTVGATTTGSPADGITFAGNPYTAYVSSYQVSGATPGIQPFTPTFSGPEVSAVTPGTLTTVSGTITGSASNQADGAGNVWVADTNSHSVIQFNPGTPTAYRYEPCLGGSTTCASAFNTPTTAKPYVVSIDSTGSIWVTVPVAGSVVQIIGAASPTWPLLSLGLIGKP